MVRRILIAALLAAPLVVVGFGEPAHAKGPISATIRGPDIESVKVTWSCPQQNSVATLAQATDYWMRSGRAWEPTAPAGDLGPMYQVLYQDGIDGEPYDQRLYPLAENGPVVYVPPDQGSGRPTGWRSTPGLGYTLEQLGVLESEEPELQPAAEASTETSSDWSLLAIGAVAGALLASATRLVSGWRRRRA